MRKTRTEEYWQGFSVSEVDVELLYELFIEQGLPQTVKTLALEVMKKRCREEDERIEQEKKLRPVFEPQKTYQVGQQLTFPREGQAVGTVVDIRPGNNPAFGKFSVIMVAFPDRDITKQFATGLDAHPSLAIEKYEEPEDIPSIQETFARYGPLVMERLESYFRENEGFAGFQGEWILSELIADVHIGHLNLSEALIEMAGRPLTAEEMLDTLELPPKIDCKVQALSLKVALAKDDRFVQVGDKSGRPLWYLARLGDPGRRG